MDLTFIYLPSFVREWNRRRLTDGDLQALEQLIAKSPTAGAVMRGAGGLRKIRFSPPSEHRGKSGSTRVGYAYFQSRSTITVVAIFAKNEASNFTAGERSEIAKLFKAFERSFK